MIYVSTIIILRKHRLLLLLAFYASNSDGNTKYIRSFNFRWLSQIESKFCQRIYTMNISRDDLVVSKNINTKTIGGLEESLNQTFKSYTYTQKCQGSFKAFLTVTIE